MRRLIKWFKKKGIAIGIIIRAFRRNPSIRYAHFHTQLGFCYQALFPDRYHEVRARNEVKRMELEKELEALETPESREAKRRDFLEYYNR